MKSDLSIFYTFLCVVYALFKEVFKSLEIYLGPSYDNQDKSLRR